MESTQKNKHKSRIRQRKSRRELGSRMYKNYSAEMLEIACESVASHQISSRDAERQFGIPRRTIINKLKNKHTKSVGHPTALTSEEENKIVKVLQASSSFGSPLTKVDLKLLVYEYLKKNSQDKKFKNRIPGDAWVQGFLARHAGELTLRTTQNISKARAEKGPQEIANYFDNLTSTLKDIPAENIINFDETNLSDDPGSMKAIFRRGIKYPERIANSTKGNISVMFTATASGRCLPLYVVYKATTIYSEWINGGPPDTRYNCTKSGWFNSAMFEDYFEKIVLPWAQKNPGTKVVICDNLSSHLSVKVIEMCEQNDIKFVFIPPRSTHLTQPLDVAFFAPLKKAWRKILCNYKIRNPVQTSLNKKHFPKLLSELIETIKIKEKKNILSGFKASGVFPINPQEVLKKIPEMQEEILSYSYGIDQALIDYLKETRTPKPMQVKRNKKINCEPGKSVTVSDLNEVNRKIEKKKTTKKKSKVTTERQNENIFLDDKTGIFVNKIIINKNDCRKKNKNQVCSQDYNRTPETLSKLCLIAINSYLVQSVDRERPSSSGLYHRSPKITILSDIIIKERTLSDILLLKDVSGKSENTPFVANTKRNLPDCLKENRTKDLKKSYTRNEKITKKLKNLKVKTARLSKRRKKQSDESSSVSDIDIVTADTDDSEYNPINDYIDQYLQEDEKENFVPADISFGLHDIEYYTETHQKINVDDWIIAQFATKKSLKHYVGRVLSIDDNMNPTVKFARRVRQFKCEKGTIFTYPTVDDICTMQHLSDVITVLPQPNLTRRGQIVFNVNFSDFNIQ